jgi:hypothetical protein
VFIDARERRDKMPLIAGAELETEHASRHLTQFFEHLAERARAHPHLKVRVEWSDTWGTGDFGWGRCTMEARSNVLALRAEAADQRGLEEIEEFVMRHLESHDAHDQSEVRWEQADTPAASSPAPGHRRERMRRFHRRARPSAGAD